MIRGGVHVEGIRAREVLLLPQTLKNRRQLAHKLLRYTINEKFRNTPVLLLRDYRLFFFFSFFFDPRSNERTKSFRSSRHVRSKAPPTFAPFINKSSITKLSRWSTTATIFRAVGFERFKIYNDINNRQINLKKKNRGKQTIKKIYIYIKGEREREKKKK